MNVRVEGACGIDVHKSFLVATILNCEGIKETKEFNTGLEDLIKGSKYLRRMLVQCAHVIARCRPNKLRFFFQGILMRKGKKIAIVALARKLLSIIHHLLKNNENYLEDELKPKKIRLPKFQSISELSLDEMIDIISKAGFTVEEISSNG